MASNITLYPSDYPETISGPTELELRVLALELGLRLSELQLVQSRRENAQSTIDLRTEVGDISVFHSRLTRSSISPDLYGRKGFFIGGETVNSLTDKIYRLNFLTEEFSVAGVSLVTARHSAGAASTARNAFIAGGNTTSNISGQIDKLNFLRETVGQISVGLLTPRSELSAWSTSKQSYFWGGANDGGAFSSSIEALSQPVNTVRLLGVSLGTARSNATSLSSNNNGYAIGGKTALGQNFASSIYKFNYDAETITPAGFALATAAGFAAGVGNQTYGYVVGGRTAVGAGTIGTIFRVDYAAGSILPISVTLTTAKSDLSGCGSSEKGYLAGGGTANIGEFRSNAETSAIERIEFAGQGNLESVTLLSVQLGAAAVGSTAISDYAPAIQSAKSKTIQGLYDPFYSKLGHRHDDRYRLIEDTLPRTELRQKLNANLDLFVDILNVAPAAIGLGSMVNPFGTITAAINYAKKFDFNGHRLKIKVANGAYDEAIVFDSPEWIGLKSQGNQASIILEGNITTPAAVVIRSTPTTSPDCIRIENAVDVWIRGIKLQSIRPNAALPDPEYLSGISARDGGTAIYSDIVFGTGFEFQLLGNFGGQLIIAGDVFVEGDCVNHVKVTESAGWSSRSTDLNYSIMPGITSFQTHNIDFATGLTMQSIFYAEVFSYIDLQYPLITFSGGPVTGYKAYVAEFGRISTGKAGNIDSLLEWDYIPATLGYRDVNNLIRTTGSSGPILGVRTFAQPISIPNGVLAQDAVNLSQLNSFIEHLAGGTTNWLKIGNLLLRTESITYGDGSQGQFSAFTFGSLGGYTYSATPWVGFTQLNGDQTASFVIDYANSVGFGIRFRTGAPSGGSINWISIGPT